jgi:hypothetical protein
MTPKPPTPKQVAEGKALSAMRNAWLAEHPDLTRKEFKTARNQNLTEFREWHEAYQAGLAAAVAAAATRNIPSADNLVTDARPYLEKIAEAREAERIAIAEAQSEKDGADAKSAEKFEKAKTRAECTCNNIWEKNAKRVGSILAEARQLGLKLEPIWQELEIGKTTAYRYIALHENRTTIAQVRDEWRTEKAESRANSSGQEDVRNEELPRRSRGSSTAHTKSPDLARLQTMAPEGYEVTHYSNGRYRVYDVDGQLVKIGKDSDHSPAAVETILKGLAGVVLQPDHSPVSGGNGPIILPPITPSTPVEVFKGALSTLVTLAADSDPAIFADAAFTADMLKVSNFLLAVIAQFEALVSEAPTGAPPGQHAAQSHPS